MTAQSLFDAPVIDPTPPRSGVRRTDPETSHQAARANRPQRNSQRQRLLGAFANNAAVHGDGLTDEEAGDLVGLDHVAATRRLSELRQCGWIAPTGTTRPTRSGCESMVCLLTDAGREVLGDA